MQLTKKFIIPYTTSKMTTLTPEQVQDLREEYIDFKINEMSREEMADWIRTVYLDELERCTVDELEYEFISYSSS